MELVMKTLHKLYTLPLLRRMLIFLLISCVAHLINNWILVSRTDIISILIKTFLPNFYLLGPIGILIMSPDFSINLDDHLNNSFNKKNLISFYIQYFSVIVITFSTWYLILLLSSQDWTNSVPVLQDLGWDVIQFNGFILAFLSFCFYTCISYKGKNKLINYSEYTKKFAFLFIILSLFIFAYRLFDSVFVLNIILSIFAVYFLAEAILIFKVSSPFDVYKKSLPFSIISILPALAMLVYSNMTLLDSQSSFLAKIKSFNYQGEFKLSHLNDDVLKDLFLKAKDESQMEYLEEIYSSYYHHLEFSELIKNNEQMKIYSLFVQKTSKDRWYWRHFSRMSLWYEKNGGLTPEAKDRLISLFEQRFTVEDFSNNIKRAKEKSNQRELIVAIYKKTLGHDEFNKKIMILEKDLKSNPQKNAVLIREISSIK